MNLVKQGYYNPEQWQQGLGLRLFGKTIRVGKWLGGAIRSIGGQLAGKLAKNPILGGLADELQQGFNWVAGQIDNSLQNPGLMAMLTTTSNGEITSAEEKILNEWLLKFDPFVLKLMDEVEAALKLNDIKAVIIGINAVLNKIDAIQDHYNVTKPILLSQNAVDQRNAYIYTALEAVHTAAKKGLEKIKGSTVLTVKEVNFPINTYNFQPLFAQSIVTTVTSENYAIGSTKQTIKPGFESQPGGLISITKPGAIIPKVPVNTGIVPAKTVNTKVGTNTSTEKESDAIQAEVITDVPAVENNPANTSNKSKTTKVVLGGLLLVAIAIAAAKAAKKKKKAATKKKSTKNK